MSSFCICYFCNYWPINLKRKKINENPPYICVEFLYPIYIASGNCPNASGNCPNTWIINVVYPTYMFNGNRPKTWIINFQFQTLKKNHIGCPRDLRLSAWWGPNSGPPLNHSMQYCRDNRGEFLRGALTRTAMIPRDASPQDAFQYARINFQNSGSFQSLAIPCQHKVFRGSRQTHNIRGLFTSPVGFHLMR